VDPSADATRRPRLSAVVVVGRQRSRAQRCLDALSRQTALDSIEILVADLAADAPALLLRAPERTRRLGMPGASWGAARERAVREAGGEFVAFVEDHCVPALDWAERLLEAHREPWAAIGYGFTNANPQTYMGRAAFLADYAPWADPAPHGPARLLPGNNVSYRKDALLALGDGALERCVVDFNLHEALLLHGRRLFVDSRVRVAHENFEDLAGLLAANHEYARLIGSRRAQARGWRLARAFYALAAPVLVPPLRLVRLAASLRGRPRLVGPVLAALPVLLTTYWVAALGEALGYALGDGGSVERFDFYELHRARRSGA
jgi:hypothetical protein